MKPLSLIAAILLVTPLRAADDGFVPLFNGKDLTGWVPVNVHPSTFFVKDGEIVTTGKPTGYMRSEKQYENFILEMEWMHVNKEAVGNSGLFVWGDVLPVTGSPFTRGIEVQVLVNLTYKDKKSGAVTASSHGDVFSIQGATCKPDRPHPTGGMRCIPSEFRAKGGGEWNHYKVTAKDGVIKLEVNGKEVSGVSECKPHRKGYLALESEGAECHFRNIKIKELPSTNPKPEEVGPVAQGHVNLLTGIELLNWKASDETKKHWKFRDHVLVYDGAREGEGRELATEKEFDDFELIVDWRSTAKGDNALRAEVAVRGKLVVELEGIPKDAVKPVGQWNRLQWVVKGDRSALTINGKDAGSSSTTVKKGPIILRSDGPIEFANIFVRELKEK